MSSPSSEFQDAASYLSGAHSLAKVSTQVKLELYGLFKYLTVSPAPSTSRPSIFDMTGRAKWDAWNAASKAYTRAEEAEHRYLEIARTLGWKESSQRATKSSDPPDTDSVKNKELMASETHVKGGPEGMGVVVSTMALLNDAKDESIHGMAVSNDVSGLIEFLEKHPGIDLNKLDEFGYSPLHLASDRGHLQLVQILLERGADVAIKDPDGFSASELAIIAGHDKIQEYLLVSTP